MDSIVFLRILFLLLKKKYSIKVLKIDVKDNKLATIIILPYSYAFTEEISIKHQANDDIKNNFLSYKSNSAFKSFILCFPIHFRRLNQEIVRSLKR